MLLRLVERARITRARRDFPEDEPSSEMTLRISENRQRGGDGDRQRRVAKEGYERLDAQGDSMAFLNLWRKGRNMLTTRFAARDSRDLRGKRQMRVPRRRHARERLGQLSAIDTAAGR
jgi:hypothetical protein